MKTLFITVLVLFSASGAFAADVLSRSYFCEVRKYDTEFNAEFTETTEYGDSMGWSENDNYLFRGNVQLHVADDRTRNTEVLSDINVTKYHTTVNLSIDADAPRAKYRREARLVIGFGEKIGQADFAFGSAHGEVRVDDGQNEIIIRCVPEGHSYYVNHPMTFSAGADTAKLCTEAKGVIAKSLQGRGRKLKSLKISRRSQGIKDVSCSLN